MNQNDPLQKLVVSETKKVDRQELSELLAPYVSIDQETKSFDLSTKFMELPNPEKILIVLAAVKARHLVFDEVDRITPAEIIAMEVMPAGSVKSSLRNLLKDKDVKSEGGLYYLPNYKVPQVVARFRK